MVTPKLDEAKTTKLANAIKSKKSKERHIEGMRVATTTLSLTAYGTLYYEGYAYTDLPGPQDYYLVNLNTSTYQLIASGVDGGSCYIIVEYPSTYCDYAVYVDGEFSNDIYLGTPYDDVIMGSGELEFDDQAAYDALYSRINSAYEQHLSDFYNSNDALSDDDMDALVISSGFDDFLPLEEFEAYFGLNSLRAQIQSEEDYWLSQTHTDMSDFPEDGYYNHDMITRTLHNTDGEVRIDGTLQTIKVFPDENPGSPGLNSCIFERDYRDDQGYATNRHIHFKISIIDDSDINNGNTLFRAQARAFKKALGLYLVTRPKMSARIYGDWWDGVCAYGDEFDSGWSDGSHHSARERAEYSFSSDGIATKDGETSMGVNVQNNLLTSTFHNN